MTYLVKHTDKSKLDIAIDEEAVNLDNDIVLFGRRKLEYGEDMNATLLHILENFACVEDAANVGTPDLSKTASLSTTAKKLLSTPVVGQAWFNKTQNTLFAWNGSKWVALSMHGDIAVNWGEICDGEIIPKPESSDGHVFDYPECVWIVSPKYTNQVFDSMICYTDSNAMVTMQYRTGVSVRAGIAAYMIVGLKGNINIGSAFPVTPPVPTLTPTATVTPTPTVALSNTPQATATRTPTRTPTPGVSSTPPPTPTPGASPTPAITPTMTPAVTVTPTSAPGSSPTPTATATATPLPPTPSPTTTMTVTPPVTPTITPSPSYVTALNLNSLQDVYMSTRASTGAWIELTFASNGVRTGYENATVTTSNWLNGSNGSDYELFYTYEDSSTEEQYIPPPEGGGGGVGSWCCPTLSPYGDPGPGASIWHDLGSDISFYCSDSSAHAEVSLYISITIRRKSDHADVGYVNISFFADGGCFAFGTKISTPNGEVNVETLGIGDVVNSFSIDGMIDESIDGWMDWTTSNLKTLSHSTSTVTGVRHFTSTNSVLINGLRTTAEHVHFVHDGSNYRWKNASNVLLSDKLISKSGRKITIDTIELDGITEYHFAAVDVESLDTLVVLDNGKEILAHNASA